MNELRPTAVVTGGSRGIGKAIAQALARQGLQIYLICASRLEAANEVASEIIANGGQASAFRLDVSDLAATAAFFQEEIRDKVEELNNAYPRTKRLKVEFSHGDYISCYPDERGVDEYVFTINIHTSRSCA